MAENAENFTPIPTESKSSGLMISSLVFVVLLIGIGGFLFLRSRNSVAPIPQEIAIRPSAEPTAEQNFGGGDFSSGQEEGPTITPGLCVAPKIELDVTCLQCDTDAATK